MPNKPLWLNNHTTETSRRISKTHLPRIVDNLLRNPQDLPCKISDDPEALSIINSMMPNHSIDDGPAYFFAPKTRRRVAYLLMDARVNPKNVSFQTKKADTPIVLVNILGAARPEISSPHIYRVFDLNFKEIKLTLPHRRILDKADDRWMSPISGTSFDLRTVLFPPFFVIDTNRKTRSAVVTLYY